MKKISDKQIRSLDLKLIIDQVLKTLRKNRWTRKDVVELSYLYRQFLYLCKKYPKHKIIPTWEIDQFWHQHILNTKKYHRDCNRIFGCYLHHTPGRRVKRASKTDDIEIYYQRTLRLIELEFGKQK